jgi:hypothetical protein
MSERHFIKRYISWNKSEDVLQFFLQTLYCSRNKVYIIRIMAFNFATKIKGQTWRAIKHALSEDKFRLLLVFFENNRCIMSAKTKCITLSCTDNAFLSFVECEIQFRVKFRVVCKWLIVGGTISFFTAKMVAMASIAPAAPSK